MLALAVTAGVLTVAGWAVEEEPHPETTSGSYVEEENLSPDPPLPMVDEKAVMTKTRLMEREIKTRVGMPAQLVAGEDESLDEEINHLLESGWLRDISIGEVESMMDAAQKSGDKQAIVEAQAVAHRAAFRFYLEAEDVREKSDQ